MFSFLKGIGDKHERLKERIHNFRIPLSPAGQKIMGFVYFCIPVIGGYYIMQAAIEQSHQNIGAKGEKLLLKQKIDAGTKEQNKVLQSILDSHKK